MQAWRFVTVTDGREVNVDRPQVGQFVQVRSVVSGKCMDVAHASGDHGTAVIQANCWDGQNERWAVTR
ncbi:RICIN domain-containing protein [Streptomyces sp. MB09-01]|uniref:RICIN domain-containing protein n=1 Tax=Streptomyces sp. MB09-01 TaxID=3028666 RepID=UPI003A5BF497